MRIVDCDSEVRRLYSIGIARSQIARVLNIPASTVFRILGETPRKSASTSIWSDPENVRTLERLWAEGLTGSAIGRKLCISRSAVLGKAFRMALPRRLEEMGGAQARKREKALKKRKEAREKAKLPPKPETPRLTDEQIEFLALAANEGEVARVSSVASLEAHHCRWPVGDAKADFKGFCGHERHAGSSYCLHHAIKAGETLRQQKCRAAWTDERRIEQKKNIFGNPRLSIQALERVSPEAEAIRALGISRHERRGNK